MITQNTYTTSGQANTNLIEYLLTISKFFTTLEMSDSKMCNFLQLSKPFLF